MPAAPTYLLIMPFMPLPLRKVTHGHFTFEVPVLVDFFLTMMNYTTEVTKERVSMLEPFISG